MLAILVISVQFFIGNEVVLQIQLAFSERIQSRTRQILYAVYCDNSKLQIIQCGEQFLMSSW